jgi:putative hemolysin
MKMQMAVIQSKEGKIIGLVTMEDLIEKIFGEIRDEHDIK